MFTQLNQYRVVLEVQPDFQQQPAGPRRHLRAHRRDDRGFGDLRQHACVDVGFGRRRQRRGGGRHRRVARDDDGVDVGSLGRAIGIRRGAASRLHPHLPDDRAAGDQPPGPVPGGDGVVQPRAGAVARRRGDRRSSRRRRTSGCPASIHGSFQGTAQAFQNSLANESLLILAALITVYIVLGVLYESYIHPVTILSTLPSAGVGALLALLITGNDFSVIALIGIILLIGIVEEERDHDDRLRPGRRAKREETGRRRRSTRPACCASGRS